MKQLFIGSLMLLGLMLLAGCSSSSSSDDEDEFTVVRLNEVVRSVFFAPQYVAIELGFFADYGIEVVLDTGQGADRSMIALIANEADIGLMGTEAAIYVFNEGRADHAMVFAQLTQRAGNFLVSREYLPNFTWDDVIGQTIIGGRPGGMPQMVLEYVLYLHNITPNLDVDIVTNLAFATTAGAFVGGLGDFTAEFDPAALEIERAGAGHVVTGLANYTAALPYTVYMANRSFIEANPDIISRFTRAIERGIDWVQNNSPQQVAEAIAPFFPYSDLDDLAFIVARYQNQDTWPGTTTPSREGFYLLQDIMEHGGELSQRVAFDSLVTDKAN